MDHELSSLAARIADAQSGGNWGLRLLLTGLIGEILLIVFPLKTAWISRLGGVVFVAFVIAGCLVEYRSETRVSALVSQEEAQAGVRIADANRKAKEAVVYAARLGVSQRGLHDFVAGKQREIDQQFGQFKVFATDEKRRNESVIADLNAKRAEVEKARADAVANATAAVKTVEAANAALAKQQADMSKVRTDLNNLSSRALVIEDRVAPRHVAASQVNALVTGLSRYKGRKIRIEAGMDAEASGFANELYGVFSKAGLSIEDNEVQTMIWTGITPTGLHVHVSKPDEGTGTVMANLFRQTGVEPKATYVTDQPATKDGPIRLVVGSK